MGKTGKDIPQSGPAAQWRHRLRRKREHPEWKDVTEPNLEEIAKLVKEVEDIHWQLVCERETSSRLRQENFKRKLAFESHIKGARRIFEKLEHDLYKKENPNDPTK